MPKPIERKRLKDRIVESISKAVKQIQRLHHAEDEEVVLRNNDWQFHKLVQHLDHALMHGLRHITNGYWVVVQEFTPKATIKDIKIMQNITTNLGKGRAWLYLGLMDRLLESYIKCFIDDHGRVSKFYLKDALMLDKQQVEVIYTLVAGLEYITFNLEVDVPYLDLSSHEHVKAHSSSCEEDLDNEERFSLASTSSTLSLNTMPELAIDAISLQADCAESPQKHLHVSLSTPVFQQNTPALNRHHSLDITMETSGGLEVIRHKIVKTHYSAKGKKKKQHREKKKADSESLHSTDTSDMVSISSHANQDSPVSLSSSQMSHDSPIAMMPQQHLKQDSPLTPESGYRSVTDNNSPKGKIFCQDNFSRDSTNLIFKPPEVVEDMPETCLLTTSKNTQDVNQNDKVDTVKDNCDDGGLIVANEDLNACKYDNRALDYSQIYNNAHESNIHVAKNNCDQSSQLCLVSNEIHSSKDINAELKTDIKKNSHFTAVTCSENNSFHGEELCNGNVINRSVDNESAEELKESIAQKVNTVGVHSKEIVGYRYTPEVASECSANVSSPIQVKDNQKVDIPDWEVKIDNNIKLYLMLEVFHSEDETFIKMFRTCLGHTEGEVTPIYLTLTDSAIYIVTPGGTHNCRFHKEAMITFKELDYISLSIGDQVINIVCTNRRKQFWITTGDETLTKCIVGHLDNAIRHSVLDLPRLSVLTDATIQKIAIKKWANSECVSQNTDSMIMNYALVYWEDVDSSNASNWLQITATKSGTLHYKSHDAYFGFGAPVWKKTHCVLRDGALYLYGNQQDSLNNMPALNCIHLNHEECQGCRTSRTTERENCFEVLLKDGSSILLSADNLTECHEWLQSLCQAVAHRMGSVPTNDGCLACCSVLTSNRLLLCHEDVQTNFLRMLGAANVIDINDVFVDESVKTYCVIKFNAPSQEETQKWVLYFNSPLGRDNFVASLELTWLNLFQVKLNIGDISDTVLRQHCRENVKLIRQQHLI